MTYLAHIGTRLVSIDTEKAITCLLVGQRDEMKERPSEELEKERRINAEGAKEKLSPEEKTKIADYMIRSMRHHYGPMCLEWFETEAQAVAAEANWTDRINFQIVPVTKQMK